MPLERFYRLPDEKRDLLLEVAASELAEKGFEGASLNSILATAGLSKGSYYYYFTDKEDLYAEAVEDAVRRFGKTLTPLSLDELTAGDFWQALGAHFRTWSRALDASPHILGLLRSLDGTRRRSPRFAPVLARTAEPFSQAIEKGKALGCIRTDLATETLVHLILALDDILIAEQKAPNADRLEQHAELALDTHRRLLEPRPGAKEPPTKPA